MDGDESDDTLISCLCDPSWLATTVLVDDLVMDNDSHKLAAALEQVERLTEQTRRLSDTVGKLHARNRELEDATVMLRSAREKAEEDFRIRNGILANISHETRTSLNAIVSLTHLLQQTALTGSQGEYLRKVEKAAHTLLRTVNDVIDFSSIESGKVSLDVVEFDFGAVIANVIDMLALRAEEKNLELFVMLDERLPPQMRGDPMRIEQVLLNLLANAIKFTRYGEIELRVRLLEAGRDVVRLRVEIRDTGIGITPVHLARLFVPAAASGSPFPQQYGGNGLGLAISKRLVDLMGGRIWVQSTYRVGSTFFVELPLGAREDSIQPSDEGLRGRRVLVVEHDPRWRKITIDSLKQLHVEATACADGNEALALLRSNADACDLMLATWRLPDQPVEDLLKAFDGRQHSGPVIAVMARGLDRDEVLRRLEPHGIHTVVTRPFTPARLRTALLEAFGYEPGSRALDPEAFAALRRRLQSITGKSILVVDDHPLNREIVLAFLSGTRIRVDVAENGLEALEKLIARPAYDLVLMDLQMPEMDGLEATRAIRKRPEFQSLPVVALTAESTAQDFENTRNAGMNAHLTKPIHALELLQTLLQFLGHGQEAVELFIPAGADIESPIIPGVDCGSLLDRIGGSVEMMYQLLDEFVRENRDVNLRIAELLENSDTEAERLVHKLKGSAGNLGINEVFRICSDLQACIRSGRKAASEELLSELAQALEGVTRSIGAAVDQRYDSGAEGTPDAEQLRVRFIELGGVLLQRRPLPCQRILRELKASELDESDRQLVARIGELVETGMFREARTLLESSKDLG
jgi:two-component system, sensor histidine kinase and response regulator